LVFDFCFCILDVAFFDFGCWVFKCCFFLILVLDFFWVFDVGLIIFWICVS